MFFFYFGWRFVFNFLNTDVSFYSSQQHNLLTWKKSNLVVTFYCSQMTGFLWWQEISWNTTPSWYTFLSTPKQVSLPSLLSGWGRPFLQIEISAIMINLKYINRNKITPDKFTLHNFPNHSYGLNLPSSSWPETDVTDVLGSTVTPVNSSSSMVNISSGPEIGLSTISSKESNEMLGLCIIVQVNRSHSHAAAIPLSLRSSELTTSCLWSISPWDNKLLSSERMVWGRSWASTWWALCWTLLEVLLRTWCWTTWSTTEKWSKESAKLSLDGKDCATSNK